MGLRSRMNRLQASLNGLDYQGLSLMGSGTLTLKARLFRDLEKIRAFQLQEASYEWA